MAPWLYTQKFLIYFFNILKSFAALKSIFCIYLLSCFRTQMEQQNKPVRKIVQLDKVVNTYKPVSNHQNIVSSLKFSTMVLSNVLLSFAFENIVHTYFWILDGEHEECVHKLNVKYCMNMLMMIRWQPWLIFIHEFNIFIHFITLLAYKLLLNTNKIHAFTLSWLKASFIIWI